MLDSQALVRVLAASATSPGTGTRCLRGGSRDCSWCSLTAPRVVAVPDAVPAVFPMYQDFHGVTENYATVLATIQAKGVEHVQHPVWFEASGQLRFAI